MKRILFQGDSITDAGRNREDDSNKGVGYPTVVAAKLGYEYPGEYEFLNRGISGNRVVDLLARIKVDMINLKPDYMSILIGINDVWHEVGCQNGISAEKYEELYNILIRDLLEALPDLKIMILEPFVLDAAATGEHWEYFHTETIKRAEAAKRIAEKYNLPFIPLQNRFDEACKLAPASYWLRDGVHPTSAGHELIAKAWIETFETIK